MEQPVNHIGTAPHCGFFLSFFVALLLCCCARLQISQAGGHRAGAASKRNGLLQFESLEFLADEPARTYAANGAGQCDVEIRHVGSGSELLKVENCIHKVFFLSNLNGDLKPTLTSIRKMNAIVG